MTTPHYQIFAIKYAEVGRKAWGNFVDGDPHEDWDMPLDYFVWAIVGAGRTFVVDTGFDAPMAKKRDRKIVHPVDEGLEAVGIRHAEVEDVIVTHMHYDHCGNGALFPNARFHMQDTEMEYVTGRCMCHHQINHAFEADDVSRMVHRVFAGRVQFHDGTDELAPGITVHKIGGHTKGLQCVRVATERGPVVLASDATHFYAHIDSRRVFRVLYNQGDMLEGYNTLERLAGGARERVIPGHDPLVLERYPEAAARTGGWAVRVDLPPRK
jgi:glyoxylase-like metal-dependent hydrolase (beta-lactamase superfamily II)